MARLEHPFHLEQNIPASETRVLTVITTCMGRLHHLRESLPAIASQSDLRCVVVDYGCPDGCGGWVAENFPGVQVVQESAVTWFNISKARNLGARHAVTEWLCFVDADTVLGPGFYQTLAPLLKDRHFLLADPCTPELSGLVVCRRDDFDAIGGYDELFSGWGSEDRDLVERLKRSGCILAGVPFQDVRCISHDDEQRTRHHDISDRFLSLRINGLYFQIKTDLARQTEVVELPLADRRNIFSRVRQVVLNNPRAAAQVEVALPMGTDFMQPPGWQLRRTIRYSFEPLAPPTDA